MIFDVFANEAAGNCCAAFFLFSRIYWLICYSEGDLKKLRSFSDVFSLGERVKTGTALKLLITQGLFWPLALQSCAPPTDPLSSQNASSVSEASPEKNATRSAKAVNYGGAKLGDAMTQEEVKTCVGKGMFYERGPQRPVRCTDYALAKIDCSETGVKLEMSPGIKGAFENVLNSDDPQLGLKGFVVDQCLDCPTADANPLCSSVAGNEGRKPGFIIYFLKQTDSQGLRSMSQFIPRS